MTSAPVVPLMVSPEPVPSMVAVLPLHFTAAEAGATVVASPRTRTRAIRTALLTVFIRPIPRSPGSPHLDLWGWCPESSKVPELSQPRIGKGGVGPMVGAGGELAQSRGPA